MGVTNADAFKMLFEGLYATELWSWSEDQFLKWLNSDYAGIALPEYFDRSIPRIMKFDEVVDAQPGTVIWLEDFDKPTVIPGLVDRVFIMTRVIDFQLVQRTVTADLDKYNRTWRCWTSKPNQAEMEARPWLS